MRRSSVVVLALPGISLVGALLIFLPRVPVLQAQDQPADSQPVPVIIGERGSSPRLMVENPTWAL